MQTTRRAIILIIATSFLVGVGQILWKLTALQITNEIFSFINVYFVLGAVVYVAATLLMILAFRGGELSVLHPFLATTYIWVALLSPIIFVSESLNVFRIIGVAVIFVGVSLIGIGGNHTRS